MEYQQSKLNDFFKNGDEFYINFYEEHTKKNCIFHAHKFIELCYIYQGEGYHKINENVHSVKKGELFIIEPDVPHTLYRDENGRLETFNIMFKPSLFDKNIINFSKYGAVSLSLLISNPDESGYFKPILEMSTSEQMIIEPIIKKIYREYTQKDDGFTDIINVYMIELIIQIMRITKSHIIQDYQSVKSTAVVNYILSFLNEKYLSSLNLNELAKSSFYSKNYLCSLFKEQTGLTMSQYIQTLRIKDACELLINTDLNHSEICVKTGFSDIKSFNTVFKRITGETPKEYRKSR